MATKVVMEALSPTMEEGRLVKWMKNEGDAITTGDILAEVETDKAVMELVARGDGILRKRLGVEGDASPVGTLLAVIAAADEDIEALVGGAAPKAATDSATAAVANTSEGAGATSVPETAAQSQGDASMPPQEKVSAAEAPVSAATRSSPTAATRADAETHSTANVRPGSAAGSATTGGRQRSSPLARRLASERGIELAEVHGSGPGGRIIKRDIENAPPAEAGATTRGTAAAPKVPRLISRDGDYQDIPLTQIRKTIARRLAESIGPVPTFYLTAEFDAGRAADMRAQFKELGDSYKVSFNDIIIKAVATALVDHPEINAHWMGDHIRHFNRVHVAMAVAIPEGLITPVIFDAAGKSLSEISIEAKALAERARQRKLTPDQYTGSTFSVSNLGMLGIEQFTAIINPPEAGILAVGSVESKPVVVDGDIEVRQRMRVTMSCDHRVIDGAMGAKFLQTVKRLFENPLLLVI